MVLLVASVSQACALSEIQVLVGGLSGPAVQAWREDRGEGSEDVLQRPETARRFLASQATRRRQARPNRKTQISSKILSVVPIEINQKSVT